MMVDHDRGGVEERGARSDLEDRLDAADALLAEQTAALGAAHGALVALVREIRDGTASADGRSLAAAELAIEKIRGGGAASVARDGATGLPVLPCPFCGGPAEVEEWPAASVDWKKVSFSVSCVAENDGPCPGYGSVTRFSRRGDAVAAWNRRVPA
jgi:hypothetical protein